MKFAHFFVDRPIFASVLSIVFVILGLVAYAGLPVAQYPEIAPPTIVVRASYPGANAETVAATVATPLEQEINGVEDMLYMSSYSTGDGSMSLTITFKLGTNLDQANVLVQNRVASATPRLPDEVRRLGVTTRKSSPDLMMVVHMLSPDDSYDQLYISNYASIRIRDQLLRLDGIGDIQLFGAREYSIRVWLDPNRLAAYQLTAADIVRALQEQNIQVSGGALGQQPAPTDAAFQLTVQTQGRFEDVRQFRQVIVKSADGGRLVRVGDVARVELGARDYVTNSYLNGKPAVALAIFQRPGSNALAAAEGIIKKMNELKRDFPSGIDYQIVYNPTEFVAESVRDVADVTHFPEMLNGRIKTLHPVVHGALLARRDNPEHMAALAAHDIAPIDVVVVNLYPFRETAAKPNVSSEAVIEQIDIGGPSMLRSAAKNFAAVYALVDPADYESVLHALEAGDDDVDLRRFLAEKVYAHTAAYDSAIATWFAMLDGEQFPANVTIALERAQTLRYGENPSQHAAFYVENRGEGLDSLTQRGGRELSFNNLLDLEGALFAIDSFAGQTACAIIKHTSPCGIAVGSSAIEAYKKALACDPVSAFGSVIAFTVPVDDVAAETISSLFVECIVAPTFSQDAVDILGRKKNLRVLEGNAAWPADALDMKRVRGGFLVQERGPVGDNEAGWRVATSREPTNAEYDALRFAWRAVASVKSNAIVLAKDGATIGIGAGQMSRVDASFLAVHKARQAGHDTKGSVLGSDAFFPFRDGVDQAAEAGVRAIIQPGGSVRDAEVIEAANAHDIAMVFTGQRQFRH